LFAVVVVVDAAEPEGDVEVDVELCDCVETPGPPGELS
jgi:hypothetical protein